MTIVAAAFFGTFGLASIAGGAIGFRKAGSRASLIAGSVAGALLLLASGLLFAGASGSGLLLGGVTSVLLAGRFVPAFIKTQKAMPQGLMAALSATGMVVAAVAQLAR
jgi:uncharacterized membrane protein (UPF0136 family)